MNKNSLGSSVICNCRWATSVLGRGTGTHRQTPGAEGLAIREIPIDPVPVLCRRVLVSLDEPCRRVWLSAEAGKTVLSLARDNDARRAACAGAARRSRRLVWRWQRGGLAYAVTRSRNFGPGAGTGTCGADCRRLRAAGLEIVRQRGMNATRISSGAERAV